MNQCTQNSTKTPQMSLQDKITGHILETVNHAIFMFNNHSTSHFYVYCEEQLTTLLPLAKMLTMLPGDQLATQIESTIDLLQRGEDISEIVLQIPCSDRASQIYLADFNKDESRVSNTKLTSLVSDWTKDEKAAG